MPGQPRPFIGVMFRCCRVYVRIYLNRQKTAYVGYCPRCASKVVLKVAPGGSKSRFWTAE